MVPDATTPSDVDGTRDFDGTRIELRISITYGVWRIYYTYYGLSLENEKECIQPANGGIKNPMKRRD
jgi:hypothetical protein